MLSITSSLGVFTAALAGSVAAGQYDDQANSTKLLTDIDAISRYWGQITTYHDNPESYFGVENVGVPDGCQVVQAHTLQRHANRFPTSSFDDGSNDENFASKLANFTQGGLKVGFTGPLAFLNSYRYIMGESYLTGLGAAVEFESGTQFWNRYGRTLYNASKGQLAYEASFANGSARPKPVLRTTGQSRIENSQISWALGFFGPSFQVVPDPTLSSFTNGSLFDVVIIPEGGTENNTLASYDSCFNDNLAYNGDIGDRDLISEYVPKYLKDATARLQKYAPSGFTLTVNDTYAMQSICAYETQYISSSDFCPLFTADEWAGFENTLDIEYYYDYAWGSPTGRAQGLGYLQELLARLTDQYIPSSNSSVNSTLDNNPTDFPLGRPFYADFSHDDIIISVLVAESLDYLKDPPSLSQYPPNPKRKFNLANLTPFGARLVTEVIACNAPNPDEVHQHRTQYYPSQYGYVPGQASYKFVRQRLNNGILPLASIRGGACGGRKDGLCAVDKFLQSQQKAEELASYDFSCFANYTLKHPLEAVDYDGAVTAKSDQIVVGGQ